MASNVVYQESTGSWVARGSSDDTGEGSTSSNPNYGKTAAEINYSNTRKLRERLGVKDIDAEGRSAEEFKAALVQRAKEDIARRAAEPTLYEQGAAMQAKSEDPRAQIQRIQANPFQNQSRETKSSSYFIETHNLTTDRFGNVMELPPKREQVILPQDSLVDAVDGRPPTVIKWGPFRPPVPIAGVDPKVRQQLEQVSFDIDAQAKANRWIPGSSAVSKFGAGFKQRVTEDYARTGKKFGIGAAFGMIYSGAKTAVVTAGKKVLPKAIFLEAAPLVAAGEAIAGTLYIGTKATDAYQEAKSLSYYTDTPALTGYLLADDIVGSAGFAAGAKASGAAIDAAGKLGHSLDMKMAKNAQEPHGLSFMQSKRGEKRGSTVTPKAKSKKQKNNFKVTKKGKDTNTGADVFTVKEQGLTRKVHIRDTELGRQVTRMTEKPTGQKGLTTEIKVSKSGKILGREDYIATGTPTTKAAKLKAQQAKLPAMSALTKTTKNEITSKTFTTTTTQGDGLKVSVKYKGRPTPKPPKSDVNTGNKGGFSQTSKNQGNTGQSSQLVAKLEAIQGVQSSKTLTAKNAKLQFKNQKINSYGPRTEVSNTQARKLAQQEALFYQSQRQQELKGGFRPGTKSKIMASLQAKKAALDKARIVPKKPTTKAAAKPTTENLYSRRDLLAGAKSPSMESPTQIQVNDSALSLSNAQAQTPKQEQRAFFGVSNETILDSPTVSVFEPDVKPETIKQPLQPQPQPYTPQPFPNPKPLPSIQTKPTRPPNPAPPKVPVGLGGFFSLPKKGSSLEAGPGYKVLGKRFGQWFPVSKGSFSEAGAINLGSRFVDNTLAASFKIERSGLAVDTEDKKGAGIPLKRKGNIFIEPVQYRLNTPGELKEIKKARRFL